MKIWMAVLGLAACGGHHPTAAVANSGSGTDSGSASASASSAGDAADPAIAKCGTKAKADLCACLTDDEVDVCDLVDDGKLAAHVLRAGNGQQTDTFLVVDDAGGLRPIAELYYEQQHGMRESTLEDPKLTLQTIGSTRIVRVDYHATSSTQESGGSETDLDATATAVCVLDGKPGCPITTYSACSSDVTSDSDPEAKGSTSATIAIGADGTATVTPGASTGDVGECAIEPATMKLVP